MISEPLSWISHRCLHNAGIYKHQVIRAIFYFNFYLWLYIIDKYRHSANSSHETSNPRGSGVHTVRTLQGLQGFVLNFDFGMYLNQIFSRHFAGVQINTKWSESKIDIFPLQKYKVIKGSTCFLKNMYTNKTNISKIVQFCPACLLYSVHWTSINIYSVFYL